MTMGECQLQGAEQLIANLAAIDEKIAGKWIRTSLRNGAKVIQSAVVSAAPGVTKAAIKVRAGKRTRTGTNMLVTLSKKFFPPGETFFVGFWDRGHKTGSRKSKNRRNVPGTFDFEHAFDAAAPAAMEAIQQTLTEGLAEETARMKK